MSVNMEVSEMDNVEENTSQQDNTSVQANENVPSPEEAAATSAAANRPLLIDVPIQNENVALNVLVGFLNLAQRRGSFNFKESAKIGECIEMFVNGSNPPPPTDKSD